MHKITGIIAKPRLIILLAQSGMDKLINPSISFFYQGSINVIDEMINFKEIVVEPEPVIVTNNIKGQLKRIVKKGDRIKLLGYWSSQIQEFSSFPLGLNKVRTTLNLI